MANNKTNRRSLLMGFFVSLDTPGGHIAICLSLLVYFGHQTNIPLSHDIAIFAMGVLSRSMGSVLPENKDQQANHDG
jgi:hypothetical protein